MQAYQDTITLCVTSGGGAYNQFLNNQINGQWDGTPHATQGVDDGIVLLDESHDEIENNVIQNTWDAGIESVGSLSDTLIADNHFHNVQFAAVASYIDTSWQNNTVRGNRVDDSLYLLEVGFNGLLGYGVPIPTTVYFQNNQVIGNIFTNPTTPDDILIRYERQTGECPV